MRRHISCAASLALLVLGLLLVFEVIRPFRDLSIDGPIAMGCWVAGALLAAVALWRRQGARAANIVALALNVLALLTMGGLLLLLATSTRLF
jgi:ABC-type uncharacterized transport system permease subunit